MALNDILPGGVRPDHQGLLVVGRGGVICARTIKDDGTVEDVPQAVREGRIVPVDEGTERRQRTQGAPFKDQ